MKVKVEATIGAKPYVIHEMDIPEVAEKDRVSITIKALKINYPDKEIKVNKITPFITG